MTPPLQAPPWSLTLSLGDIFGLIGLVIGGVGLWIAYLQYRKATAAKQAVDAYKTKLFKQRSAQRFSDIAPKAAMLAGQIRIRDWQACAESATEIGSALSNAVGFCSALIVEEEGASLELAGGAVEFILEALPIDAAQGPDAAAIKELTKKCMIVVYAVERIAGRLKALDHSEAS